jgi:hypothetical protein
MDDTVTQVVEDMENGEVHREVALTTRLVRHKEEMESVTGCLKKVEQKFLDMQT